MKNMLRRPIAMLLAMVMILSCVPMEGLAAIVPVNGPTTSSDGISLFSIVQPPMDTYTYIFKNGEETVSTQIVKNDESLLDPGTPNGTGKFLGWYDDETGEQVTFGTPITVTETKTINCTPKFDNILHVYFKHGDVIVATKEGQADADGKLTVTINDVTVNVGAEENFNGWELNGTKIEENSITTDTDVTLTASVSDGHWITFESQGGTYVEPLFVANGEKGTAPDAPTRPGYTFDHWSKSNTEDGSVYNWDDVVTASLTLYAVWTARTDTQYTVIHWLENADDTNYSYKESETKTGTTGQLTEAAAKTYAGFTLVPKDDAETKYAFAQQTIAGDGSTIVNVYYRRIVCSIYFMSRNSSGSVYSCGKEEHTHSEGYTLPILGKVGSCYDENGNLTCTKEVHTHSAECKTSAALLTITAKYGANISDQWPTSPSSTWSTQEDGSYPHQSGIDTMPLGNKNNITYFYQISNNSWSTSTATYYVEILNSDDEYDIEKGGKKYKKDHSDTATSSGVGNLRVTAEDRYDITGFTLNEEYSTDIGSSYNGAKFYYTRNSYKIFFMSGGSEVHTETKKYQENISTVSYTPTGKDDYTFGGWYEDESLKVPYSFATVGTMPANNITVYAKWNPPVRTLTVQLKWTMEDGRTEEIIANIPVGEDRADELDALQKKIMGELGDGYEWHGWKKLDGTPFNVHTKIDKDTTIYASFSRTGKFKVVYDANKGTGTVPVDNNDYADGAAAAVLSGPDMTAPANKVFLGWNTQADGTGTTYQPGSSLTISAADADKEGQIHLHAQWGNTPDTVSLTYYPNYPTGCQFDEPSERPLYTAESGYLNNVTVTVRSVEGAKFPTPTGYEFSGWATTADGTATISAGDQVQINNNGSNDLYAVWTVDESQKHSVGYTVKYFNQNDEGGYDEMTSSAETHTESEWIGKAVEITVSVNTSKDLPAGYAFEKTEPATLPEKYTVAAYGQSSTNNVINVYYKKNEFTVSYEYTGTVPTGAPTAPGSQTKAYGKSVDVEANPTLAGYTFSGWTTTDVTVADGKFTMPAKDVKFTGSWSVNEYTVTYKPGDHGTFTEQKYENVEYGTATPAFAGEKTGEAGYTFTGWDSEVAGTVTNDATYTAQWKANENTKYTVEWYLEDLNGNYPTTATASDKTRTGTTDTTASVTEEDKAGIPGGSIDNNGITLDASKDSEWSGTIVGSGTLVLRLYFKRNSYKVTYEYESNVAGQSKLPEEATYKYGETVKVADAATAAGYKFSGWSTTDATIAGGEFTMPAKHVTITGSWSANTNTAYKVEHYQQNLNDTGFTLKDTENLTGTTGATATATAKNYTGFTFDDTVEGTKTSGTIAGDGSLVLMLYYTRNKYTVTYTKGDHGDFTDDVHADVKYDADTPAFAGEKDAAGNPKGAAGYTFTGWNPTVAEKVTNTVTYIAQWTTDGSQTVDVTYVAEAHGNVTNDKDTIQIVTAENLTGSTATANSGYKFVGWYKGDTEVSTNAVLDADTAKGYLNTDTNGNYAATEFVAKFERDFENGGDDDTFKFSVDGCEEMYDGTAYTVTINGLIKGEDFVSFSTDGTTWTDPVAWDGTIPDNLEYTNVGEYHVYVKATNGDVTSDKNATVKITPRPVTIKANSATLDYDGNAHQAVGEDGKLYTVSGTKGVGGLLEGHDISENNTTGTGTVYIVLYLLKGATDPTPRTDCTYVGEYTASVYPGVQIVSDSENVTKNYAITLVPGLLKITGAELNPSKKVDGKPADEKNYKLDEVIYFTITVTNQSAEPVENVVVVDADEIIEQDGVTVVKQNDGTYKATIAHIGSGPLAENTVPGNVVTLTVKHVVTEDDILAGKYTNTATIGDKEYTVTADVEDIEDPNPALKVTKTTTSEPKDKELNKYKLGETITYEIKVENTGNLTISNVVVTDQMTGATFDENKAYYTVGTAADGRSIATLKAALAPKESVTLTAKYTVTEADVLAGSVKNTATASGDAPDETKPEGTGEATDETEDKNPHLTVVKESTNKGSGENGVFKRDDTIEYKITVTNDGNLTISNVVVTDQMTGATFDIDNGDVYTVGTDASIATLNAALAPGKSVTLTAKYTVTEADILEADADIQNGGSGKLVNVATAKGSSEDPDTPEPEGTGKSENDVEGKKSHLTVTKTDGREEGYKYTLGERIIYTITVTNDGNQTIKIDEVKDQLEGAWVDKVFGGASTSGGTVKYDGGCDLKPDESLTIDKVTYVVKEADILAGTVTNTATATGTDPDGKAPEVENGVTTDLTELPNPSFSLEKTLTNLPNKGYFTVGETAEFDVLVTNDGNMTLNVNVSEGLDGATFYHYVKNQDWPDDENIAEVTANGTVAVIKSLVPGRSVTLKARYTVTADDLGKNDLKNVVTGEGEGPKNDDPERPTKPEDKTTEENIPVDDAVIVTVTKKWDDEENKYESRPESVSFTLYQSVDKENSAIGKLVVSEETDWTAKSGKLPKHTEDGEEIHYTLTEETVTGYDWSYTVQLPPSADTNDQLPPQDDQAQDDQAREAEVVDQKYTVTNTLNKHKLTIRYWKNAVGGEKVTGDYSAEYAYNAPYSVQSPDLYGWDADMSRVEGRMPDEDLVVDVVYRQLIFKLTIYYIFEDGTTAHKEYEAKLTAGEKFEVESPEIEGYKPNLWMISGEMPARDLNYTVIYMAQNTPVDLSAATAPLGIGNVVPNAGDCFD